MLQEEAEQSRVEQVSNSKRPNPEAAAEETQDETQPAGAAEGSFGVHPTVTASGVRPLAGPTVVNGYLSATPAYQSTASIR